MIKLEIKSIRIESTNKNHRPVLRKKTLREKYSQLITQYKQKNITELRLIELLMDQAVKSMTVVPDQKYKRSREELSWRFKESYTGNEPIEGRLHVTIFISTYKDSDNFKIIMDSLQDAGIIKNDRDVILYTVVKTPIKRGQNESIIVQIHKESEQQEFQYKNLSDKIEIKD